MPTIDSFIPSTNFAKVSASGESANLLTFLAVKSYAVLAKPSLSLPVWLICRDVCISMFPTSGSWTIRFAASSPMGAPLATIDIAAFCMVGGKLPMNFSSSLAEAPSICLSVALYAASFMRCSCSACSASLFLPVSLLSASRFLRYSTVPNLNSSSFRSSLCPDLPVLASSFA